jgi:hypothetical protein
MRLEEAAERLYQWGTAIRVMQKSFAFRKRAGESGRPKGWIRSKNEGPASVKKSSQRRVLAYNTGSKQELRRQEAV